MTSPSEPDRYSIDEMMERLKTREPGDPLQEGELVTRPDGSQAVKVRKRKRRSHQPVRDERRNRRNRMVQLSAALILLLLAVFAAGVAIAYANSAPFRNNLLKKITNATGAETGLRQFRMNPAKANAGGLVLRWPEGNPLKELNAHTISAEIAPASFLGQTISGQEVVAKEATLVLRIPDPKVSARLDSASTGTPSVRFRRYAAPKFHLVFGDPAAPAAKLVDSEASLTFNPGGKPQLHLVRGQLVMKGWPLMQLDRSLIEFRDSQAEVLALRFGHESDLRAFVELSGGISPFSPERASNLAVRVSIYPLAGLAGPGLGGLFSGKIESHPAVESNYLTFTADSGRGPELAVSFHSALSSNFELHHFPFLHGLARSLDDDWFSRPVFGSDVRGELRRTGQSITLRNLLLESKGRMALRGSVSIDESDRLSGELEVGVSDAMVKSAQSPRLETIMTAPVDGFRWITITIGGSASAPTDNFSELFSNAAPAARQQVPEERVPSFEELTEPE